MNQIENFKVYQGSECLMSCIQNLFCNKNIQIGEEEIFIVGDGFRVAYRRINRQKEFKFDFLSDVHRSIFQFCNIVGISYVKYKDISDDFAENRMMLCIAKGDPVIAKVDPGYLKYNPIYQNGFGLTHFINIIGVDLIGREKKVKVCDGFIPTYPLSTFQGWVDYSDIKEGRKTKGNELIEIDCSSIDMNQYRKKFDRDFIKYKLRCNLYEYLNSPKNANEYLGVAALKEFCKDLPYFIEYFGDNFTERMIKLNYEMKIHGLFTSRQLLLKLIQGLNYSENGRWLSEEMQMKYIIEKWDNISLKIVKTGISKKQNMLEQLVMQIMDVIIDEITVFEKIIQKI